MQIAITPRRLYGSVLHPARDCTRANPSAIQLFSPVTSATKAAVPAMQSYDRYGFAIEEAAIPAKQSYDQNGIAIENDTK